MRRIAAAAGLSLLVLAGAVAVRSATPGARPEPVAPVELAPVDAGRAAQRLAAALRYATISHFDSQSLDREAFLGFHRFLERSFPRAHRALGREAVEGLSLLYRWPGRDASLDPLLLLAHQDVVPAAPETAGAWTHPPFAGVVADGFVWGRGSMDDKGNLMAILEAVEWLLGQGFQPRRTLLLAFGHDEEVGGAGAQAIARRLAQRGVRAEFVLDEGSAVIAEGVVPGVPSPVAFVGVGEKGYLSVELSARTAGGHSSTPPRHTAVGIVASAIHRMERHPLPARLDGATRRMFEHLGPEMSLPYRAVFSNLWLFGALVKRRLAANPATNATMRTTAAATMFQGGPKDNVLPSHAWAVVNFRILPGDDVEGVLEHVRLVVDDARVEVRPIRDVSEPSPESDVDSPDYRLLRRTIREVFGGIPVAPNLVLGGTDARHYLGLSPDVYRFSPMRVSLDDLSRPHGIDERVSVEGHADAVRFYVRLIQNAAS